MPWDALTIQIVEGSCPGMPCHSNALKWYHMHIALVVVVGALSESLLVSRRSCSGCWLG